MSPEGGAARGARRAGQRRGGLAAAGARCGAQQPRGRPTHSGCTRRPAALGAHSLAQLQRVCLRTGMLRDAQRLPRARGSGSATKPTRRVASEAFSALVKAGQLKEAEQLFRQLVSEESLPAASSCALITAPRARRRSAAGSPSST